VKVQQNDIDIFVLDTVIELVWKVERRLGKVWITQKMVNERRTKNWRNVNNVEGRKKELQKTEKIIEKERREVHEEIP
jgi:hypothetical protein